MIVQFPTKEEYLENVKRIQNEELNSDRFRFVINFLKKYHERGSINKEKQLLKLIGNYDDDHIDEINKGYEYTKEKKFKQYRKLSNFLNSLSSEEINSNFYLKIAKYLMDISENECTNLLQNLDQNLNNREFSDNVSQIEYQVDIPKDRLDILQDPIHTSKGIPYYKPEDYKISYIEILDSEHLPYYETYNSIVGIVQKMCEDIYSLQIWNLISRYREQIKLSSLFVSSYEKAYSLCFYVQRGKAKISTKKFKNGMAYPTDEYLGYIMQYAIEKNGLDINQISKHSLKKIIWEYRALCIQFQERYVRGELDTFKRAACLLVAIKKCKLFYGNYESRIGTRYVDENTVVNVSLDAAFKMCENSYWFIGENSDIPYQLNSVDFDKMFEEDSTLLKGRKMFIDSIKFEGKNYLSYADTLQLWHYTASIKDGIVPGIELNKNPEKELKKRKLNEND